MRTVGWRGGRHPDAAQDAESDAVEDVDEAGQNEDGGEGQPDTGSDEVEGTRVTLRGGCGFAPSGSGGSLPWLLLGLVTAALVRTPRRTEQNG